MMGIPAKKGTILQNISTAAEAGII